MKFNFLSGLLARKSQINNALRPKLLDGRDAEVVELYHSNLTMNEIAQKLNVSKTVLYEKIASMRLSRRSPRFRVKKVDERKILELKALGLSNVAIAKKLKIGITKLNTVMIDSGLRQRLSDIELEKFRNTVLRGKEAAKRGEKKYSPNKTNKLEKFAEDIQDLLLDGITKTAIAERYNVSVGTIYNLIKICDLKAPFIKKLDVKEEILKKLFNKGLSQNDIAERLNCSTNLIAKKIKEMGLSRPQIKVKSPVNNNIELIKELYAKGCSNREIAKRLNVHPVWLGKKIKQLNLPASKRKTERNSVMKGHDEELKHMYLSGMHLKDIGAYFGVQSNAVIYRLTKLGIYHPCRKKEVAK